MYQLIEYRIKCGDEQAFEVFFKKYYVRLCLFANKYIGNPEEAKDLVLDVFTFIWENRETINPEESLKSYVFTMVKNRSLNVLRKKKTESKYFDIIYNVYNSFIDVSTADHYIAKELELKINATIESMPPRCREIFELSRKKGMKYNDIANSLNISTKTVEVQMCKALSILRSSLQEYI